MASESLKAGMTLNRRYRLEHPIGVGGMGATFLATDLEPEQKQPPAGKVVVKTPLTRYARDTNILTRFRREAEMHQSVAHPNIAALLKVDEIQKKHPLQGLPFIVLDFIDGTELHKYVEVHADKLSVGQFLQYMHDISLALDAVHSAGLVHRDVKPRNIMVKNDDTNAVLVDFGLALGDDLEDIYLSSEGVLVSDLLEPTSAGCGTPAYMAPEVWEGIGIGPVSDVYAMGVMMYEFLTGSYPFNIRRREDFKVAHRDDLRTPPSSFNPMFTSKMDQVLLSSLQKASAFRPEKPSDFTGRMIDAVKTAKLENLLLRSLQRESVPNFRRDQQKDREKSPVGISGRMQRVYDNQWSAEDRKKLRNMDIFHGMAARDVILLLEAGLLTEFEKGKTLFRKGEPADKMYVIIEGEVEIIQPASLDDEGLEPGVDRVINRVGPGTVFGEIALLLGDVRTASVRAATDVRALGIGQQELDLIVARPHRASLNLLINLARSVARTLKKAEERTRTGSSDSIEAVTDK